MTTPADHAYQHFHQRSNLIEIGTYAIGEVRENARRVRSWKVPVAPEIVLASRGSSV